MQNCMIPRIDCPTYHSPWCRLLARQSPGPVRTMNSVCLHPRLVSRRLHPTFRLRGSRDLPDGAMVGAMFNPFDIQIAASLLVKTSFCFSEQKGRVVAARVGCSGHLRCEGAEGILVRRTISR